MEAYKIQYDGKEFTVSEKPCEVYSTPGDSCISFCSDRTKALAIAAKKNNLLTKSAEAYCKDSKLILVRKCKNCGEYFRIEGVKLVLRMPTTCRKCNYVPKGCFFNRFDSVV